MTAQPTASDLQRARDLARTAPPVTAAGAANLRRLIGDALRRRVTNTTKAPDRAA